MKQLSTNDLETDQSKHLQHDIELPTHTHKYTGNIKVLTDNIMHLSVGPDYPFSVIALVFLLAASYGLFMIQKLVNFGIAGKIVNYAFMIFPPLAFLMTLLKNPGIYDPEDNYQPKRTYCNICKVFIPKGVYHCRICNVCIEEWDHHCPWLSKCIGKKNFCLFTAFVGSIPLTFFYFCFLIYCLMANQPPKQ